MKSFSDLVALDSRIGDLLKEAQSVKRVRGKFFCANAVWYGEFRCRVRDIVGNWREEGPSELQTSKAYDVVYKTIYRALPDCRKNCLLCV